MTIALTFDVDWAPDAVIEDTLALVSEHGARATLFATHATAVLRGLDPSQFDVGIHPNFNPLLAGQGGSIDAVLDGILEAYPDAKGVRSHSMTQSSGILGKFAERGLVYDANHFLPYLPVQPFRLWTGMLRIPYNWEDDVHWAYGRGFASSGLALDDWPLCVLDFHPIHVYLNTESAARYEAARPHYHEPSELAKLRNTTSVPGSRDLLISLLRRVQANASQCRTLAEVAAAFTAD